MNEDSNVCWNLITIIWLARCLLGFADARGTCCRTGTAKTRVYLCNPTTAGTCRNSSSYVFFDGVHPSEAANLFMAESMVEAGIELVM